MQVATPIIALFAMFATTVACANECANFEGQTVAAVQFSEIAPTLRAFKPKDEFETTNQYAARAAAFADSVPKAFVIRKRAEDLKFLPYDADRGELTISRYAMHNRTALIREAYDLAKITYDASRRHEDPHICLSVEKSRLERIRRRQPWGLTSS